MAQVGPADEATVDDPTATSTGAIVVTGSRIARPDVDSASPVTVVGAAEVADTGTVRVEDLVNSLPQVVGGQNAFITNGASGTATVDLRGLGTARTLVLVNGRRLQPGDPGLPAADLNQIPASLIERVEVLTGGASATYGADAVAGVVNFVMDTDFEGVRLDATYGFYQHDNGTS
ncbi:MAG: TonB-dependent receptor plug domain-containing protein, partial [Pseudomonadota bacterium]|nr:TonB-dependent receptor plug domain-containing protein [Pseudomonadota bacterium]